MVESRYTRFEKARLIGARALQLSMGAPILIKDLNKKEYLDHVLIAMKEFNEGALPIIILRTNISEE